MKRTLLFLVAIACIGVSTAYSQLFPKVDKPTSPEMSLLVLHFANEIDGELKLALNNNATGWAPAVTGPDGEIVPFRKYDSAADVNNIYYAENLEAGEYTLTGFYHVYVDYALLETYKKEKNNPNFIASYGPFDNMPFHIKQHITLKEPVKINLEANKVMSLGNFAARFEWVGGPWGTTDDRWKVQEDKTEIFLAEPFDEFILRYIKPWRTRSWKPWNEKNSAKPL